jgi:8-amino-7-oxononanoate synthase
MGADKMDAGKMDADEIASLTADEKRAVLARMLKTPQAAAPAASPTDGFIFPPEYALLKQQFQESGADGVSDLFYRSFDGVNANRASMEGVDLINFCSYNYLGMSGHPSVSKAAADAIATYGTSVSASRLVSGERPLHSALEAELSSWMGAQETLVFVGGFSTNEDVIGHLMGEDDLILYDSLIHSSVQQGARLSRATVLPFPHNNLDALENILARRRASARQVLIIVEGVYSMDGDIPDLARLIDMKRRHNCLIMVDEAHSMGVLGATGRGIAEYSGINAGDVDIWMGTLSKSFASCGGYIAGSHELVTYLRHTAPGFVYSVGLAPPLAAAALEALKQMRAHPETVTQLQARAALFHERAQEAGLDIGDANPDAAVVPIMVGESKKAIELCRALLQKGVLALPIGFPAVPENKARLRFFISSTHSEDEIKLAVDAVAEALASMS